MAASSPTPPEDYGQSPLDIESEVPGVIVEIEAKDGQTVRIPKSELEFAENLKDQLEYPPDSDSVIYIKLKNIDADVLWKMSDYLAFLKKVHTTEMSYEECVEFEGLFLSLDSEKPLIFAMLKASSELGIVELGNYLAKMIADDIKGMSAEHFKIAYAIPEHTTLY